MSPRDRGILGRHLTWFSRYSTPAVILSAAVGLALSLAAYALADRWDRQRVALEFGQRATDVAGALMRSVTGAVDFLQDIRGLYDVSPGIDRRQFRTFVSRELTQQPSISLLEWVPRVLDTERAAFEDAARREGSAGFEIIEQGAPGMQRAAHRAEYFPIFYIEPEQYGERPRGFDVAASAVRRAALEHARDTGRPTATAPGVRLAGAGDEAATMVFVPVYRAGAAPVTVAERRQQLRGFAVAVLRPRGLVETSVSAFNFGDMGLELSDVLAPPAGRLLYRHLESATVPMPAVLRHLRVGAFTSTATLAIAERRWELRLTPTPAYISAHLSDQPWAVLVAGLALTTAFVGYLMSTERRRHAAERLATLGGAIARSLEPAEVAQQIADGVCQLIDGTSSAVFGLEDDSGDLVALAVCGATGPARRGLTLPAGAATVGAAVAQRRPIATRDFLADPRIGFPSELRAGFAQAEYRSVLAVPLIVKDRIVGALSVGRRAGYRFDEGQVRVAQLFAAHAALALDNARLHRETHARLQDLRAAYDELSRTQQQLTQAQKMEAVGRLAGGVAHDFNNLLTIITGRAVLLRARLAEDAELERNVALIEKTAQRAAALTRQLLAFSRKQVLQPKVLDLNTLVSNVGSMLRRLIGEDVTLLTSLGPSLAPIKADPGQLEQVLMNLVVNARDAMPHGGAVTIETAHVVVDASEASRHADLKPGPYVSLAVTDTGTGMDGATLAHMFEPFFTTKEPGKGTGLGLATVYGIVKQSGGHITVDSEVGHGTTFKVYLPAVEEPAETAQDPALATIPRGSETILLVEDEVELRELLAEVLRRSGYEVLTPRDGPDALATCAVRDTPIHLVLTDVIMPQMSGPELVARARTLRPDLKVLYMSGYTDSEIVHHGVLDPAIAFIHKPFTPSAVAQKIREVLDASPRPTTVLSAA